MLANFFCFTGSRCNSRAKRDFPNCLLYSTHHHMPCFDITVDCIDSCIYTILSTKYTKGQLYASSFRTS